MGRVAIASLYEPEVLGELFENTASCPIRLPSIGDRRRSGHHPFLSTRGHRGTGTPFPALSASFQYSQLLLPLPGCPRRTSDLLFVDARYDSQATREALSAQGIDSAIRYRNRSHGSHLGRFRWPVERTISWIKGLRRMRIRNDRHLTLIDAWEQLTLAAICFRILHTMV